MYLWEIQDGCHFQLTCWPIWCNPRHKLLFFIQILYHYLTTVYYCLREPVWAVFISYLRGAQFTLRTDHRSLRWLQKFRKSDGMLPDGICF